MGDRTSEADGLKRHGRVVKFDEFQDARRVGEGECLVDGVLPAVKAGASIQEGADGWLGRRWRAVIAERH